MEAETTAIGLMRAAGLKKVADNLFDDLYSYVKQTAKRSYKEWKTRSKVERLYSRVRDIRRVKTIWQFEKEVDLDRFYYPSKLKIDDVTKQVNDTSQLPYNGNMLIEGTAGQGKSIFFRFLTAREFQKGKNIPVFIELRRLSSELSLRRAIDAELSVLGFDIDSALFDTLADEGKFALLLDAFDEVSTERRPALVGEVEELARQYPKVRILVSARPSSELTFSPHFRVFRLAELAPGEYEQVLFRICDKESLANKIIEGIRQEGDHVKHLLSTPLMVALLVCRYKADQSIPKTIVSFYDHLLPLLLQRHDKTKAGFVRKRKSNLSDSNIEDAFDGICYYARKDDLGELDRKTIVALAKKAIEHLGEKANADDLVDDIVEITCLILRDGDGYRFIHRSVQEFHAAQHVRSQPEANARQFYEAMSRKWRGWKAEVAFLQNIDEYRFWKFFGIPELSSVVQRNRGRVTLTMEAVKSQFGEDSLGVSASSGPVKQRSYTFCYGPNSWFRYQWFDNRAYVYLLADSSALEYVREHGDRDQDDSVNMMIGDLLDAGVLKPEDFRPAYKGWDHELRFAEKLVQRIESQRSDFDFD